MNSRQQAMALCALIGSITPAQAEEITVNVNAGAAWVGFMNVFDLPEDGGTYIFSSIWGVADLRAVFSGSTLTLAPNTIGDPNEFWYQNTSGTATPPSVGGPGQAGNKSMDANLFVEVSGTTTTVGALSGHTVTFTGTVSSNTLTDAHRAEVFIKDFAPGATVPDSIITAPLVDGEFSITLDTAEGVNRRVQYGFQMLGENVWITDVAPFGDVVITAIPADPVVPGNPNVTVDPAAPWLGYINRFNLSPPDGDGAFVSGNAETVLTELRAAFSGNVLTLSPFTIEPFPDGRDDPFWYRPDGSANKIVDANFYVQAPAGTLTGQTVNFTGTVLNNSLTSAHTTVAFIKDFAPDFSTSVVSSVILTPGAFSISLPTINDPARHIQYGFQTIGPNVWPEEAGDFGFVQVSDGSVVANPYAAWIAGFDFSGFTNPDLSPTGDPDGDGQSNLEEFALNGNPASGAASGRVRARLETVGGEQAFVMTLPVRGSPAPVFSGSPSKTATADQVTYTIEGSNGLLAFDQEVTEVSPARDENLPANGTGWTYRSFRLDGPVGGNSSRGPSGFLRAKISTTP